MGGTISMQLQKGKFFSESWEMKFGKEESILGIQKLDKCWAGSLHFLATQDLWLQNAQEQQRGQARSRSAKIHLPALQNKQTSLFQEKTEPKKVSNS